MNRAKWIFVVFFCFVFLSSGIFSRAQEQIFVQTPFRPIKEVYPHYPEKLKQEGVPARFLVWITIDRKGNVTRARIANSLFPELEEDIEKAFALWTFEPYIHGGEPIRTFGFIQLIFYPGNFSFPDKEDQLRTGPPEEFLEPANRELRMVLDKCAVYCLKLSESALFYICHERIRERTKSIQGQREGVTYFPPQASGESLEVMGARVDVLTLGEAERHFYLYDYQLIRKDGRIEEKRILMEKDRRQVILADVPRGTKPLYSLKSILIPVQILGIEHRSRYSFRMDGEEKIDGKPAYVIEAALKPGQRRNIQQARIWIDKSNFRVVKAEVASLFVDGFEQVIPECNRYYLRPHFKSTHFYGIEKNGLLFPSRSQIRCEYSGFLRTKRDVKSEVDVTYGNYKFFIVETNHEIIKRKLEELDLNWHSPIFKLLLPCLPEIRRFF